MIALFVSLPTAATSPSTPLQRFSYERMALLSVSQDSQAQWTAKFWTPEGIMIAKVGTPIGTANGTIVEISRRGVKVSEMLGINVNEDWVERTFLWPLADEKSSVRSPGATRNK